MNLDEVRGTWTDLSGREARLRFLEARELEARWGRKKRQALWPALHEGAWGLAAVLVSGSFAFDHWQDILAMPLGVIPCAYVWLLGALTLGGALWKMATLSQLTLGREVAQELESCLRGESVRARMAQWALALGMSLWMVFPLFGLQLLGGYRAVFAFDLGALALQAGVGVVLGGLLMAWFDGTFLGGKVRDALFGEEVKRIQTMIEELRAFQREP